MSKNENTINKGLAALTTNPFASPHKPKFTDNSTYNQRLKILDWLLEKLSITSIQAREQLDIYHPPARIFELRHAGYQIATVMDSWTSEHGIKHRISSYVLTHKLPVELIIHSEVT